MKAKKERQAEKFRGRQRVTCVSSSKKIPTDDEIKKSVCVVMCVILKQLHSLLWPFLLDNCYFIYPFLWLIHNVKKGSGSEPRKQSKLLRYYRFKLKTVKQ